MHTKTVMILSGLAASAIVFAASVSTGRSTQSTQPVPPKATSTESAGQHQEGVNSRGDHAMGFSHETTTHHFRLYETGGAIEVLANDPADSATRDEIRMHLSHIVKLFSAGDFNVPMFIHSTVPPGAATMSKRRALITYRYEQTGRGGRILIATSDRLALQAIHAFLRFQISDHQTGDTNEVSKP